MERRTVELPRKKKAPEESQNLKIVREEPREELPEEAVPRESRKKRLRRRRRKKALAIFLRILVALLGLALFLGITVGLIYLLCNIKKVNVVSCEKYTAEEMEEFVLNDEYSFNSVYVYFKNLILPVTNIPFVESYQVKLNSPTEITIVVKEKELFAYVTDEEGRYVYFDSDGVVQEVSERLIEGVLLIDGISCEDASVGKNLPVEGGTLLGVLTLIKNLRKYEIAAEAPAFDNRGDLWVVCGNVRVNFGSVDNMAEKVTRLSIILPKVAGYTGILHLEDWTPEHTDIIFEKK